MAETKRPKMRDGVIKRGASWYYVTREWDPQLGRKKPVWHGKYRLREDAVKARREALGAIDAGTYVRPTKQTVGQFLTEDWLPSLEAAVAGGTMKSSTAAFYRHLVERQVITRLGGTLLARLDAPALNRFYGELLANGRHRGEGGLSPTTVHSVHVTIGRALADAVRWHKVARNVATEASPPAPAKNEMKVWSDAQLRVFLEAVADDRLFALWHLAITSGMRRGELCGLRWTDVDLDATSLRVASTRVSVGNDVVTGSPKTMKGRRTIGLDLATIAVLRAHKARQAAEGLASGPAWTDTGLVFTAEDGQGLHPNAMTNAFGRISRQAGLPPIRFHDLRHSYATAALEAGEDLKVVSARLGHSGYSITADLYTHVQPHVHQAAANRVASHILRSR
jgi:integrase